MKILSWYNVGVEWFSFERILFPIFQCFWDYWNSKIGNLAIASADKAALFRWFDLIHPSPPPQRCRCSKVRRSHLGVGLPLDALVARSLLCLWDPGSLSVSDELHRLHLQRDKQSGVTPAGWVSLKVLDTIRCHFWPPWFRWRTQGDT